MKAGETPFSWFVNVAVKGHATTEACGLFVFEIRNRGRWIMWKDVELRMNKGKYNRTFQNIREKNKKPLKTYENTSI